jgi:AcrR family transcriptional regulator
MGFSEVAMDEIARAAGVSTRTLFRYFPSKEDLLLGFTRRGLQALVDSIAELSPGPDPLQRVWRLIREHALVSPQDVRLLTLWRRAAADAPEIHARVKLSPRTAPSRWDAWHRMIPIHGSSRECWSGSRWHSWNYGAGQTSLWWTSSMLQRRLSPNSPAGDVADRPD